MDKRQKRNNKHKGQANNNSTGGGQKDRTGKNDGGVNNAKAKPKSKLPPQTRGELATLVASLLEICVKKANNPREEWQHYCDIQKILTRIEVLEAPVKRKSTNATPEQRLANINAFYKWIDENGVRYDGLKISEFAGYDLGLEATRDIKAEENVISVPSKLMLSEETVDKNGQHALFDSMPNLKIAYNLMLETLEPNSFWKPYIDLLPDTYNTVLYYTMEEMEQLRGSIALTHALSLCKSIARQYSFIYKFAQGAPMVDQITEQGQAFRENFCYDLYRWAVSTVMTRQNMIPRSTTTKSSSSSTQPESIVALIPFWDMANHKHGAITSHFMPEENRMECTAQMDFKKGDQFFIHYGNRSNADLLVHNGFVNAENPNDSVAVKLGLSPSDALYEKRCKLLDLLKIAHSGELQVLPAPEYISTQLLGFVRVFNMNQEQLDHWIGSERAEDLLYLDCALETSLESKAWQFLETRFMLLLRVYPTTLAKDEDQLAQWRRGEIQLSPIAAMILEFRLLEKRILVNALDYAKQRVKA